MFLPRIFCEVFPRVFRAVTRPSSVDSGRDAWYVESKRDGFFWKPGKGRYPWKNRMSS